MRTSSLFFLAGLTLAGCGTPEQQTLEGTRVAVDAQLSALEGAARALQAAAPVPDADGWNASADAEAVARMKAHWKEVRAAYERIEGALDVGAAFRGVIGSMDEQAEKVDLGATGEEESRYARHTLADMRGNLAGAQAFYAHFQPWVLSRGEPGKAADAQVRAGFDALERAYAAHAGDSLPEVPADWSNQAPSQAALQTPYGQLRSAVQDATNLAKDDSLAASLRQVAKLLGIEEYAR
jgi:hypothetical protein